MPLDPQVQAVLLGLEQMGGPLLVDVTPEEGRVMFARMALAGGPPEPCASVDELTIPGPASELRARVYAPSGDRPMAVMVFFHGGGWVIGDLDTHDPLCRALANASGSIVVSVDYRLAPEHKFPAAVEDAYAATSWVADHAAELGADPDRLGVGGDSAGGNLSAAVALLARERGGPRLAYQLLLYPGVDMLMSMPSVIENGEGYFLTHADMIWFGNHYIRDQSDKLNPLASPLLAHDHATLPPAIVITAEYDPLRDEGEAYAEKLRKAGVPVTLRRYDGMIHGFLQMGGLVDRAREALREVGADVQAMTKAGSARLG